MFSAPTWARWSIDLPQCNKAVDPEDTSEEAKALRAEQQACNEEHTGVFPLPGLDEGTSRTASPAARTSPSRRSPSTPSSPRAC